MLPNPSPSIDTTTVFAARPQLRLAPRPTADDSDTKASPSTQIVTDELVRWQGQWRRSLEEITDALASLERRCESQLESPETEVSTLVEALVEAAASEAAAAARSARAEAASEIAEHAAQIAQLQITIETLASEVRSERETVRKLEEQLVTGAGLRAQLESERNQAEATMLQLRAENDVQKSELTRLRHLLDSAAAERSKLMTTVQLVQRVLTGGGDFPTLAPSPWVIETPAVPAPVVHRQPETSGQATKAAAEAPPVAGDARIALAEANPQEVADIKRLFEQVEAMYELDLNSGQSAMELVDSLTCSLRYARESIVSRSSLPARDAEAIFNYQIEVLLDERPGTSFGRHLSIAAYASRQPAPEGPAAGANGSSPANPIATPKNRG